jgi:hypothetical protein
MERTFDADLLREWGLPYDAFSPLEVYKPEENLAIVYQDEHYDSSRWSELHELVFRAPDDNHLYSVLYSVGLTEYQDEKPWEYDTTVTGTHVEPFEVTKVVYRRVASPPGLDEDHDHALV